MFVNSPLDDVVAAAEDESLTMLQLHGDEGPAFCQEAARRTGCKVMKAFRVRSSADIQAPRPSARPSPVRRAPPRMRSAAPGESFDWELLAGRALRDPVRPLGRARPGQRRRTPSRSSSPYAVDLASGVESEPGVKDHALMAAFVENAQSPRRRAPSCHEAESAAEPGERRGASRREERFGPYGGRFVPEVLMAALDELSAAWVEARDDDGFRGRARRAAARLRRAPDARCTSAERLSERVGRRVYLKREDLAHTGAHKINNAVGQALLAKRMGKPRVIAETGAGQHGVATATACALLGPGVRRLHGHRGHAPPGAERRAHAPAGRGGRGRSRPVPGR